jgi:uncharacterized membrane protein YdjX (TVP38/TMEM64 family)
MFFFSIMIAAILSRWEPFHVFILSLGEYGYFSAFLAGILFVSTFTIAPGAILLLVLAERLSPVEIGLIAGLGSVIADYFIFRYFKSNLKQELVDVYHGLGGHHITRLLHLKHFAWTLPVLGALIIASPLPDELGVSLMGISKMKTYQFIIVSFILDVLGIFLIVSASAIIKP